MRHSKALLAGLLVLCACGKNFPDIVANAEKSLAEKNHVDAIDSITNGLPKWKTSDGVEVKARAYEILGKSYRELNNTDKAIVSYRQAVSLSDKSFDSAFDLGNIYLIKNQPELARQSFTDALRMKPNDPLALLGLGNSYYALKKIKDAMATFEKVLDVSPGVREAQEQLAVLKTWTTPKKTTLTLKKRPTKKR